MSRKRLADMPEWLEETVQTYQSARELKSEGAALLELVALGLHHVSKRQDNDIWFDKQVEKSFGEDFETWYDAGNENEQPELLDDLEWYIVKELLSQEWGGQRDGAGNPNWKA